MAWLLSGTGGWGEAGDRATPSWHRHSALPARPSPSLLSCHTAVISAVTSLHGHEITAHEGDTPGAQVSWAEMSEACSRSPRDRASTLGGCSLAGGGGGGPHEARPPGQVPPFSTGPAPVTLQAVGTWVLPAVAPGAMSVSLCGADLLLLFLTTETLTCNDAIFLQGLLPADLERCV